MEHPEYTWTSSIQGDGVRKKVRVADVSGKFQSLKRLVFPLMLANFILLPFWQWKGQRLLLIDIQHRDFFIFGLSFNAQDIYLIFFLLTGMAFTLFLITALVGRIWCGWACPQTVFLEGVFRKIERLIEGNREEQLRLARGPWDGRRIRKFLLKQGVFVGLALGISGLFTSYFVPLSHWGDLWAHGPAAHPVQLAFWLVFSVIIFGNFAWFREQLCLIVCPYGRLQSALTDDDSLVIGYDQKRGEPRGKKGDPTRGHCIDCQRCLSVCPTGIDIRRGGLQLECVGCANCIDACDDIMLKIGQPTGLIRYDSWNGLAGKGRRILRPRIYVYLVLWVIGGVMAYNFAIRRMPFEANVLRLKGAPYVLVEQRIRNQFELHLFNKSTRPKTFIIDVKTPTGMAAIVPIHQVELPGMTDRHLPVFLETDAATFQGEQRVEVSITADGETVTREMPFLGPTVKP